MNNELSLLVQDIPKDEIDNFTKNIKSNVEAKHIVKKTSVDYTWIKEIEDAIPSIDSIIMNPRRFIVQEEDVVRIEKTKKVTLESIKDLAVHTNYIQEVDEDGFVKPIKLLNVFKEETIDLYENRFIYSLIKKLDYFLRDQLIYKEQSVNNVNKKELNYNAKTNYNNEDVSISLNLVVNEKEEETTTEEMLLERESKIKNIQDVIEGFMGSKFMTTMKGATEVRSPIRKTNLILKDYNFRKALYLWEYIEGYETSNPVKEENKENSLLTKSMNNNFDLTYYLNYSILNGLLTKNGTSRIFENIDIIETISDYAKNYDIDEKELRKSIETTINEVSNHKNSEKSNARKAFKQFIENHNVRYSKANNLFR